MKTGTSIVAECVARYAARLHADIGARHHAASPLGAWLLLALAGPAASGADRAALTDVLGCDIDLAAAAAAELLARPHQQVASAAAVWTTSSARPTAGFRQWRDSLPAEVASGELPDQGGLDRWAREHTFGLIDRFPVRWSQDLYLVLATALATRVSWQVPFELAPAISLGRASPWSAQVKQVLRTPDQARGQRGHQQFIAVSPPVGDVAVHIAVAAGGLIVISVAAQPDVPAADVLAAAHQIGLASATGVPVQRRALSDLPLGEFPLWLLREEMSAGPDACTAVLPAWSARCEHDLRSPSLGFAAAARALAGSADPWQAKQAVLARYTRTGFEAAAVTAVGVMMAMRPSHSRRVAELRFGHPYAVVALTVDEQLHGVGSAPGPWHGLPVFSAWVASPDEAADGPQSSDEAAAGPQSSDETPGVRHPAAGDRP